MFRTVRAGILAFDIIVASLAFLLRVAIGASSVADILVVLLMASVVAIHRLSPALALVIAWSGVLLQLLAGMGPDLSNLAILVMLFASAAYGSTVVRWLGFASAFIGAGIAAAYFLLTGAFAVGFGDAVFADFARYLLSFGATAAAGLTLFLLSWTLGVLYRTWTNYRVNLIARKRAESEQIAARREVAVEQERNRIARDMHDVVAHSLAVVIAQADGARYAAAVDPAATNEALATISVTAREALGDVRILLGQLRHSQGEAPQPVLADLHRLFEQMRSSGLAVERTDAGIPRELGTAAQLAIYRIVQESLTNALRHGSDPKTARLIFTWHDDRIECEVINATAIAPEEQIHTSPSRSAGHGIDGMRERALLVGGTFSAGPDAQGFRVTVEIPVTR